MVERTDETLRGIYNTIVEMGETEKLRELVNYALQTGVKPMDVIDNVTKALEVVGERYEAKEYFLMDLIVAGQMATEVMKIVRPYLQQASEAGLGRIIIGTVFGDVHNVGKNIVAAMLSSAGFDVIDLGVDVPPERFVKAVKESKPSILALSTLLTLGMDQMKLTIDGLKKAGLRGDVKVMIGGRPTTPEFADEIGADAYGRNAVDAVKIAKGYSVRDRR